MCRRINYKNAQHFLFISTVLYARNVPVPILYKYTPSQIPQFHLFVAPQWPLLFPSLPFPPFLLSIITNETWFGMAMLGMVLVMIMLTRDRLER